MADNKPKGEQKDIKLVERTIGSSIDMGEVAQRLKVSGKITRQTRVNGDVSARLAASGAITKANPNTRMDGDVTQRLKVAGEILRAVSPEVTSSTARTSVMQSTPATPKQPPKTGKKK